MRGPRRVPVTSTSRIPTVLAILASLYLGAIVAANAVAAKLFVVAGVNITSGALAIPIVYLTTDMINELYGRATTRTVVWMGLTANVVLTLTTLLAGVVPGSPLGADQGSYDRIFDITWRVTFGSSVAYLLSSLLDVELFHLIKSWTGERWFWIRKNGSTVISQAADTAIFVGIAFGGLIPLEALAPMALGQYLVKIAAAPLGTPLSYLILWTARRTS